MKSSLTQLKKIAIVLITLPILAVLLLSSTSVGTRAANENQDTAALYTANKCQVCHGPKADKKFDLAKPDAEHVNVILKGKKGEKPPFMPGYEEKGITPDQAKALVDHMKQLRAAGE